MNYNSSETIAATLIKDAIETEGCYIADIDFENLAVKVDGPDAVIVSCARAVEEILA